MSSQLCTIDLPQHSRCGSCKYLTQLRSVGLSEDHLSSCRKSWVGSHPDESGSWGEALDARSILVMGPTGRGKTALLAGLLHEVIAKKYGPAPAAWAQATGDDQIAMWLSPRIVAHLLEQGREGNARLRNAETVKFTFIDDLGSGGLTEANRVLASIIEARHSATLSTYVSTNLTVDQLYEFDARMASRLNEGEVIDVASQPDWRIAPPVEIQIVQFATPAPRSTPAPVLYGVPDADLAAVQDYEIDPDTKKWRQTQAFRERSFRRRFAKFFPQFPNGATPELLDRVQREVVPLLKGLKCSRNTILTSTDDLYRFTYEQLMRRVVFGHDPRIVSYISSRFLSVGTLVDIMFGKVRDDDRELMTFQDLREKIIGVWLGSGNIQPEPQSQALCRLMERVEGGLTIVPGDLPETLNLRGQVLWIFARTTPTAFAREYPAVFRVARDQNYQLIDLNGNSWD